MQQYALDDLYIIWTLAEIRSLQRCIFVEKVANSVEYSVLASVKFNPSVHILKKARLIDPLRYTDDGTAKQGSLPCRTITVTLLII